MKILPFVTSHAVIAESMATLRKAVAAVSARNAFAPHQLKPTRLCSLS